MPFPEYSFRSPKEWSSHLIDIRQAIETGTEIQVSVSNELSSVMQTSFEELRSDLDWTLTLVAQSLDEQRELLQSVVERLDAPLFTQSQELFRRGCDLYARELFKESLRALLGAEKKNSVNFALQLQIGLLYLYGRNSKEDVTDLEKAEQHLVLADQYARAYQDSAPEWRVCAGQGCYEAGRAAYLQARREEHSGFREQSLRDLNRARDHTAEGVRIWPKWKEGRYLRAKILCLLEDKQASIDEIKYLADRDRRYLRRAHKDEDFDSLRSELASLPEQLRLEPGPVSRRARDLFERIIAALPSAESVILDCGDLTQFNLIEQWTTRVAAELEMDTDTEQLLQEMQEKMQALVQLVIRVVHSRTGPLLEANQLNNDRIEEIEHLKARPGGVGVGCLLWLLVWFVVPGIIRGIIALMVALGGLPSSIFGPLSFVTYGMCFLSGPLFLVFSMHTHSARRNLRLNVEMESLRQAVAQRDDVIANWALWLHSWKQKSKAMPALPSPPSPPIA